MLCKDAAQDAWAEDVELGVDLAMNVGKAQGFFKKKDVLIVLTRWHPGSGFTNTTCVVPVTRRPSGAPLLTPSHPSPTPSTRPAMLVVFTLGHSVALVGWDAREN